jgi:hypothetical protein
MPEGERLRVFLCHSSLDKPVVRAIYERLLRLGGVDPWLDEMKLIAGQDWEFEIRKAVRSSHVVLVCLSARSLTKEGYVQREISQSLDVADEKPQGAIFLVPVRLEDCDVPERLQRWHRVDWFRVDGFERLQRALRSRAEALGITISAAAGKLIYDSRKEQPRSSPWVKYSTSGNFNGIRQTSSAELGEYWVVESFGTEFVGINKSFNILAGTIEFDYKVQSSNPSVQNVVIYVIPMEETGANRTGLVEVGTSVRDHPRNPKSRSRAIFPVPPEHLADSAWHHGRLVFDFKDVPSAFYSIFGPRVNEGCDEVGPAALAIANVRLYVFS